MEIAEIVKKYRNEKIIGQTINLVPLTEKDLADVVRLRNSPKMKYYFNQAQDLTLEMQQAWFEKYLQRKDDIYWAIRDKQNNFVGTNRIYSILPDQCEQGSVMVDESFAMGTPYAAEALMLSFDFAFDVLQVKNVVNENRHDNKNMNALSRHFGFKKLRDVEIRGVTYFYHELQRENYNRELVQEIINSWLAR